MDGSPASYACRWRHVPTFFQSGRGRAILAVVLAALRVSSFSTFTVATAAAAAPLLHLVAALSTTADVATAIAVIPAAAPVLACDSISTTLIVISVIHFVSGHVSFRLIERQPATTSTSSLNRDWGSATLTTGWHLCSRKPNVCQQ